MGSVGSPSAWAPYESYRDCSQGICSIYCPQWCYIIFPPPPPPDDDSATTFSPLIIAVIGILATAFLLVSYYTVVSKYCRRRRRGGDHGAIIELDSTNRENLTHDQLQQQQMGSSGLDESLIKSITVCKYKKGDGLIQGTDCAVCLSEFQENESFRLMPNCNHAFHLPCIDTWLKSHPNCPLCRSNVVVLVSANPSLSPQPHPRSQASSTLSISSFESQPRNEVILVMDDVEIDHEQGMSFSLVSTDLAPKIDPCQMRHNAAANSQQWRRSVSFDSTSNQRHLSVAEILRMNEEEEDDDDDESIQRESNNGSPTSMGKSISTGGIDNS